MSNEILTEPAPAKKPAPASTDLSAAIDETISREPGEEVRSVRVFGDNYRCNWWIRDPGAGPLYLNMGRIIRSKFLRATMNGDTLVIDDVSYKAAR